MIDYINRSGSHYRVDMAAANVECIDPPEAAFPARKAIHGADANGDGPDRPELGRPYIAFWAYPNDHGFFFMRTSEVVFIGEAGEALAL